MASPYSLGISDTTVRSSVDFKANGEVSRMRSHKGNMPSLPQTKFCSLCPAKFTRTTHLNRHLRSHTNERSHKCEVCSAEFTRSDLLTRHKRTCGDSRNSNRSRRKSCQACAESKVKCNLQLPCSKCTARGRECIFINDPEASRTRRAARRGRSTPDSTTGSEDSNVRSTSQSASVSSPPTKPFSIIYPSPVSTRSSLPDSMHSSPISNRQLDISMAFGAGGCNSSSSSSSSSLSSRLESYDAAGGTVEFDFDSLLNIECQFNDLFPLPTQSQENTTFFPPDFMSPNLSPDRSGGGSLYSGSTGGDLFQDLRSESYHSPQNNTQDILQGLPSLSSPSFSPQTHNVPPGMLNSPLFDSSSSGLSTNAESEDLYLSSFFTLFSAQIPLIHRPTWTMEDKHPMLISAMKACGAIYVQTTTSLAFVHRTLEYLADNLIAEFSRSNASLKDRFSLIMAVVLLQSWNLLTRQPDRLGTSRLFHGVVVTMIRRIGLIRLLSDWTPPDLSNPYTLDTAWREWARFETLKRVVFFAYIQDCANCAYFSTMPIFHPSEIEIHLPCDDNLWTAGSVKEWYQMLQTPSPYAVGPRRLSSLSMRRALAALDDPGPSGMRVHFNLFSHLILIHTIIRNIFASGFEDIYSDDRPGHLGAYSKNTGSSALIDPASSLENKHMSNQHALHNWLQMWRTNPDAIILEKAGSAQTPIFCDAAPFYWLAHYSLQASREGSLDLTPAPTENAAQERCLMINSWMERIKSFLNSGISMPSRIQDLTHSGLDMGPDSVSVLSGPLTALLNLR